MNNQASEHSLGALLMLAAKTRRYKANELLLQHGIHVGQEAVLRLLSCKDGQTVSELVERVGIQHATISAMLARMEANGLVTKQKDPNDKRTSRVFITEKGKEAFKAVAHVWKDLDKQTIAGLTIEEQIVMRRLLLQIVQNFGVPLQGFITLPAK